MKKLLLIFCLLTACTLTAHAVRESRSMPTDSRIKVMIYNPNDVFKYTGYYGFQASIEFGRTEEIVSISMGDTTAWQIVPSGNRIFIKPMEEDATTNMTLITNKRTYFFELYAEETKNIRDPDLAFNVKFLYPDDEDVENIRTFANSSPIASPQLDRPELYNFNYYISGNEEIAPLKIFDDGEFTYMQFRDKNKEIPAILAVDEDLRESMVNFRLDPNNPNLIIIEQVFNKMTLRLGERITCVYNDAFRPY